MMFYVSIDTDALTVTGYSPQREMIDNGSNIVTFSPTAPHPLILYGVSYDTDIGEWRVFHKGDSEARRIDLIPLRRDRDELLKQTDWTQLADVPAATKARYTTYRQALRDLPQDYPNGKNVVWPTKPG